MTDHYSLNNSNRICGKNEQTANLEFRSVLTLVVARSSFPPPPASFRYLFYSLQEANRHVLLQDTAKQIHQAKQIHHATFYQPCTMNTSSKA